MLPIDDARGVFEFKLSHLTPHLLVALRETLVRVDEHSTADCTTCSKLFGGRGSDRDAGRDGRKWWRPDGGLASCRWGRT
jgi:hypothetical protein